MLVAAVLLGSVVRWLRRRRQDDPKSWSALGVSAVGAVLKTLVGLAVAYVIVIVILRWRDSREDAG